MKLFRKLFGIDRPEQELANDKLKDFEGKSDKEIATENGQPYVNIISVDIDADNPSQGSFELDWNVHFVAKLRSMGYPGATDETVVDLWFQSVCRNILLETWEQEAANRDGTRYISRRDLGDGKTEVS